MNPYGETIAEHFRHPRNYGALDAADIRHEDVNPLCGDRICIEIALTGDGIVRAARFRGDLCMIAKAAASLLMERIEGASLSRIDAMEEEELFEALQADIRPARRQCALLPLEVLRSGVRSWRRGRGACSASTGGQ